MYILAKCNLFWTAYKWMNFFKQLFLWISRHLTVTEISDLRIGSWMKKRAWQFISKCCNQLAVFLVINNLTCISIMFYYSGCSPGYFGINCTLPCRYPSYGIDCQSECECNKTQCDNTIGCRSNIACMLN